MRPKARTYSTTYVPRIVWGARERVKDEGSLKSDVGQANALLVGIRPARLFTPH